MQVNSPEPPIKAKVNNMRVNVRLWGHLSQLAKDRLIELDVDDPATVKDGIRALVSIEESLKPFLLDECGDVKRTVLIMLDGVCVSPHAKEGLRTGSDILIMTALAEVESATKN